VTPQPAAKNKPGRLEQRAPATAVIFVAIQPWQPRPLLNTINDELSKATHARILIDRPPKVSLIQSEYLGFRRGGGRAEQG